MGQIAENSSRQYGDVETTAGSKTGGGRSGNDGMEIAASTFRMTAPGNGEKKTGLGSISLATRGFPRTMAG